MKHLYIRSQQTVEAELIRSLERSVINVLAQFLGRASDSLPKNGHLICP